MSMRTAQRFARAACCLLLAAPAAHAEEAQRVQLAAERAALQSQFQTQEKDCQTRFAVTACVDDVRQRRREALAPLRARELQLDDAERSARAARREQALLAKQRESLPPAPAGVQPKAPQAGAKARPLAQTPTHDAAHVDRAAQAAERAKEARARANEARAAQAEVAKKLSQRAASGKAAAPLPVPAASATAR